MQNAGNQAKSNGSVLAVILASVRRRQGGIEFEIGSSSHIDAMLTDIGFILRPVELNPNHFIISTIK